MGADTLLSRLDKVKSTGRGRWLARCSAHEDRHASLAVRELDDGRTLVHCFAGCSLHEILSTAGVNISDLFPPRESHRARPKNRPFPAADVLRCVAFEALVVSCAAAAVLAGEPFTEDDRARLIQAASRIQTALDAGGIGHA